TRADAARAIKKLGIAGIDLLIRAAGSPDPKVRRQAAIGLEEIGRDAVPAVSALKKLLADEEAEVRLYAAAAWYRFTGDADPVLPVLRAEIRSHSRLVALRAAELGPAAG